MRNILLNLYFSEGVFLNQLIAGGASAESNFYYQVWRDKFDPQVVNVLLLGKDHEDA